MKRLRKIRQSKTIARRMAAGLVLGTILPLMSNGISRRHQPETQPTNITFVSGYPAPSTQGVYQLNGFALRRYQSFDAIPGRAS